MSTYHSPTELTINVRVRGVKYHMVFTPTTLGESFLNVDDPLLQRAIEKHPYYGKMFQKVPDRPPVQQKETKSLRTEQVIHLPYTDISDAKEELAQRTGVSRTSMRTVQDIMAVAKRYHIVFDGMPP